jgi:group I intron endonuclease
MRILKSHPLLKLVNSYLIDASQPSNISYLWNFGSLLLVCLVIQIITGVTLAMHYSPNVLEAFNSIEHIMRDVNNGWLVRYLHSNTASAFFFLVYLHIGRGMYYGSYRAPRTLVWAIGTVILILMMGTGFLGYQHSPKWFNIKVFRNSSLRHANNNSKFSLHRVRNYSTISDSPATSGDLNIVIKELQLNPVYVFENLEVEITRQNVLKSTRGLSGIYMIINKIRGDYYVGSAATNRFYARFSNHLIYFRGSKIVKAAVKKYGLENFAFLILELYPNIVTKENNKELLDLEDKYLKSLLPNYNILTEAGSSFGYKHTEIDRIKMRDIYSDERRNKIGNLNRGKNFSPETIEKMREKALNKSPMSDETKLKCISHTRPLILYNLNGTVYGQYPTIIEAAKAINCGEKTIRRALSTEKQLVKRQWIVKDLAA